MIFLFMILNEKYTYMIGSEYVTILYFFRIISNKQQVHYFQFIFTILQIYASRLHQNNNFTYIYVENNNFIPHNHIYIK